MAEETTKQQEGAQKKERVFVNLPRALYRPANSEYTIVRHDAAGNVVPEKRTSDGYNRYMIPSGVKVGDQYLSGATVIVDDDYVKKLHGDMLGFSYLKGQQVTVSKPAFADGHYVHDEDGRQVYDRFKVDAAELAEECAKLTFLVLPASYARRGIEYTKADGTIGKFNSVRITPNVQVGDNDLSNAQIYPKYIMHGYRSENAVVVPLLKDRVLKVQPAKTPEGEWNNGHEHDIDVEPTKLVAAVNKAHQEYHKSERKEDAPAKAESQVVSPAIDDDIEQMFAPEEPKKGGAHL